jgi:DedD protein
VTPVPPPGDKATSIPNLAATEKAPEKTSSVAKTVVVPVEPTTEIPAAVKAPATPESRQPEAKPAPEPKPVGESKKSTAATKLAASVERGWLVQVGAFSQLENARRLHAKLSQKGYTAILDPPNPQKGKTVRVEVGPYKDADAAKAAQARIQSEFGIKGVVRKQ